MGILPCVIGHSAIYKHLKKYDWKVDYSEQAQADGITKYKNKGMHQFFGRLPMFEAREPRN